MRIARLQRSAIAISVFLVGVSSASAQSSPAATPRSLALRAAASPAVVITGAAAGNANVKALVYIAAFGPDANEAVGPLTEKYPSSLGKALRPDAAGYLYVDRSMFHDVFAADVSAIESSVMSAAQKPVSSSVFGATVPVAAWKTIPSWYLVARNDRAINPALERFYAKRMGATTSEVNSSHVPFISQPKVVARLIETAAKATSK
jgi:pimeloyl-ACP methyl ester carboxylesterase